jgi:hypothetical protein
MQQNATCLQKSNYQNFQVVRKSPGARRQLLFWMLGAASSCIALVLSGAEFNRQGGLDEEMETYKRTRDSGEVRALQEHLERGTIELSYEEKHGYLLSVLKELNIPVSSQLLVASKTSPNKALISPRNPRALYYNDRVSIAYVPSAELLEIAAADPHLGVVFYTLEQKKAAKPKLVRDDRCLECHASAKTLDVPGLLVRSFLTKGDGDVDVLSGVLVTHRNPLSERWGGYYVTGSHGAQTHRGNLFGAEALARHEKDPTCNANITDLGPFLNISKYPEPGSDLVALMVLEHQTHMQTLLTRFAYDSSKALSVASDLRSAYPACEAVLKYMLFLDEARLTAPVRGTSDFARWFENQGLKDKNGRSLRQFDLQSRMFKYPCSFMIYSPSMDALPERARRHLYRRLHEILSGENASQDYANLSAESRKAIMEIVTDTIKDLPADWHL